MKNLALTTVLIRFTDDSW